VPNTGEIPREKYRFRYAEDLPGEIARHVLAYATHHRDSVLPLVQMICAQLYDTARHRPDGVITLDDFKRIGGVEGGIRSHVDALLSRLVEQSRDDRGPFVAIFRTLYLRQSDGTLTTALIPEDDLRGAWRGAMPFDAMLRAARDLKLLRVNSLRIGLEEERPYVSLGHDALAKIAYNWDEERKRRARRRGMTVAIIATLLVVLAMGGLSGWALLARSEARRLAVKAQNAESQAKDERGKAFQALLKESEARRSAVKAKDELGKTTQAFQDLAKAADALKAALQEEHTKSQTESTRRGQAEQKLDQTLKNLESTLARSRRLQAQVAGLQPEHNRIPGRLWRSVDALTRLISPPTAAQGQTDPESVALARLRVLIAFSSDDPEDAAWQDLIAAMCLQVVEPLKSLRPGDVTEAIRILRKVQEDLVRIDTQSSNSDRRDVDELTPEGYIKEDLYKDVLGNNVLEIPPKKTFMAGPYYPRVASLGMAIRRLQGLDPKGGARDSPKH
jgi:hypothetical protein